MLVFPTLDKIHGYFEKGEQRMIRRVTFQGQEYFYLQLDEVKVNEMRPPGVEPVTNPAVLARLEDAEVRDGMLFATGIGRVRQMLTGSAASFAVTDDGVFAGRDNKVGEFSDVVFLTEEEVA